MFTTLCLLAIPVLLYLLEFAVSDLITFLLWSPQWDTWFFGFFVLFLNIRALKAVLLTLQFPLCYTDVISASPMHHNVGLKINKSKVPGQRLFSLGRLSRTSSALTYCCEVSRDSECLLFSSYLLTPHNTCLPPSLPNALLSLAKDVEQLQAPLETGPLAP